MPTRDRILAVATALFAERGVDAVGMREIAEQVGIDVSSVHHHFPTKAGLHEACFASVFAAESRALEAGVAALRAAASAGGPDELRRSLVSLVDGFVAFLVAHPETTFLWLRRWLDPRSVTPVDQAYALPIYAQVEQALQAATERGVLAASTAHVTVRSLVWAVHGHVTALAAADPATTTREQAEFRAFTHRFVDLLYPPPEHGRADA